MRIFNVSPTGFNYGQNKLNKINAANRNNNVHYNLKNNPVSDTVSFGTYRDNNAVAGVKEALLSFDDFRGKFYHKLLGDTDLVDIYTDYKDDGKIKFNLNMEAIKAIGEEGFFEDFELTDDLRKEDNALSLATEIEHALKPCEIVPNKEPEPEITSYAAKCAEQDAYH